MIIRSGGDGGSRSHTGAKKTADTLQNAGALHKNLIRQVDKKLIQATKWPEMIRND